MLVLIIALIAVGAFAGYQFLSPKHPGGGTSTPQITTHTNEPSQTSASTTPPEATPPTSKPTSTTTPPVEKEANLWVEELEDPALAFNLHSYLDEDCGCVTHYPAVVNGNRLDFQTAAFLISEEVGQGGVANLSVKWEISVEEVLLRGTSSSGSPVEVRVNASVIRYVIQDLKSGREVDITVFVNSSFPGSLSWVSHPLRFRVYGPGGSTQVGILGGSVRYPGGKYEWSDPSSALGEDIMPWFTGSLPYDDPMYLLTGGSGPTLLDYSAVPEIWEALGNALSEGHEVQVELGVEGAYLTLNPAYLGEVRICGHGFKVYNVTISSHPNVVGGYVIVSPAFGVPLKTYLEFPEGSPYLESGGWLNVTLTGCSLSEGGGG
ncbi:MAG: hypothetical protein J7L55_03425 [Desulfurococcales archaeon]|nr:hypothetical protein [Desulfurococcales archaeon]